MKTTVDIPDDLLRQAKETAAGEGTTLRALIAAGLRRELESRSAHGYELPDRSFRGRGTQPGIDEGDWSMLRAVIYEGRGE